MTRLPTVVLWLLIATVAHANQNVVVLIDDSGSMADPMRKSGIRKIEAAKRALEVVLSELPADAQVGVLALNSDWIMPVQRIDKAQIGETISRLRASGGTPLGVYMKRATDELIRLRAEQTYGDYRLLVVTDGEASDQDVLDFVLPDIMSRGFLVDVIGVDMQSEHSLATVVHNYRRADDPESLQRAIQDALAESDDSSNAAEEDFAWVEGLPAEMTMDIITALTAKNETPIGDAVFDDRDGSGSPSVSLPSSRNATGRRSGGGSGGGSGIGFFSAIFCLMVVFFLVSLVSSTLKSITRRR